MIWVICGYIIAREKYWGGLIYFFVKSFGHKGRRKKQGKRGLREGYKKLDSEVDFGVGHQEFVSIENLDKIWLWSGLRLRGLRDLWRFLGLGSWICCS